MYRNKEVKKKSERGKEKIYDEMSFYSVFLYTMPGNYIELHSMERSSRTV